MKQLFTILNAIFANQDQDTLRTMVGDALGVDSANFELKILVWRAYKNKTADIVHHTPI